jgi:glycerol-3-phosphate dehydrogenase
MKTSNTSERIVVVGGGISGLSIAVRLVQSGLPVTVLEASKLGFGASTRNQGWLYSGAWFAPAQPKLSGLCRDAFEQTLKFCPQCVVPGHDGMLFIFSEMSSNTSRWTEAWGAVGIPFGRLSPEAVAKRAPALDSSSVQYAFQLPDRAIRPEILLEHLAATARNAGVEIRPDTPVLEFLQERDSIMGVVTGGGETLRARLVILAANVGGAQLGPTNFSNSIVEQPEYTRVALKTHLTAVKPEAARWPLCVVDAEGFNHIPHGTHSVFGTARWSAVPKWDDIQIIVEERDRLRDYIVRFFPGVKRGQFETTEWAGTTVQAMHVDQIEPGIAPMPTVIDHSKEPPHAQNLLSVFPGRASLGPQLAEMARETVLEKIGSRTIEVRQPPWSSDRLD